MDQKNFKTIIVDDDNEVRLHLLEVLQSQKKIIISAEAVDAASALPKISEVQPHLIFMTIPFLEQKGFEVLDKLQHINQSEFEIVFLAENDQHAKLAMQFGVFDYLSKPLKTDELEKILFKFSFKHNPNHKNEAAHFADLQTLHPQYKFINTSSTQLYINPEKIIYMEAAGKNTLMYFSFVKSEKACWLLKTMVCKLQDREMIRVHKRYAVNRLFLHDVPYKNNKCILIFEGKTKEIPMSKDGKKRLQQP